MTDKISKLKRILKERITKEELLIATLSPYGQIASPRINMSKAIVALAKDVLTILEE